MSLTTDSNGEVTPDLDVGYFQDSSPASDDWTSNGVIIWDPVNKIVGAATIVMDLSVVGVDLIAQAESMIVTRTRGNDSTVLNQAVDTMHFPVTAYISLSRSKQRVLTSPLLKWKSQLQMEQQSEETYLH